MNDIPKPVLTAVAAAMKKIRSETLLGDVWKAAEGDVELAQRAAWQLVRTGRCKIAKHVISMAVLSHGIGPLAWTDLSALLETLPPLLWEPGGGKWGLGATLLVDPDDRLEEGVTHLLVRLAIRCAASDPVFAEIALEGYSPKILLALGYARAVVGLPIDDVLRTKLVEALALAVVSRAMPVSAILREPGGLAEVQLQQTEEWQPCDMARLAAPLTDAWRWNEALTQAMIAEIELAEQNRYQGRGLRYLDRCGSALPQLEPAALVRVLGYGQVRGMGETEWRTIATPVVSSLSADARTMALAATSTFAEGRYSSQLEELLRA